MLEIVKFIAYIISSIYETFDVKLFPDMPITFSQLFLGLIAFVIFITFIKSIIGVFGSNASSFDFSAVFHSKKDK